jgi:hypothetical protein
MRHRASFRRLTRVETLEARDNPGNFFTNLLGLPAVLVYVGLEAVATTTEHGPSPPRPARLHWHPHRHNPALAMEEAQALAHVRVKHHAAVSHTGSPFLRNQN